MAERKKAPEPDTAPIELWVKSVGAGSLTMCVKDPEFEKKPVKGTMHYNEKKVKDAVYCELPGGATRVKVTPENVELYGFDSVPEMLLFLKQPGRMLGPNGSPKYLYSLALGEQDVVADEMDDGALRDELERRTRSKVAKSATRTALLISLKALRALSGESCFAPDWIPPDPKADEEEARTLTEEMLAGVRKED